MFRKPAKETAKETARWTVENAIWSNPFTNVDGAKVTHWIFKTVYAGWKRSTIGVSNAFASQIQNIYPMSATCVENKNKAAWFGILATAALSSRRKAEGSTGWSRASYFSKGEQSRKRKKKVQQKCLNWTLVAFAEQCWEAAKTLVKATHLLFWLIREKTNFWTKNPQKVLSLKCGCCSKILLCPSWTNTIENMGNCPRVHSSLWLLYLIEIFPPPPFCHAGFLDEWISQCFFFFDQSATTASFAF